MSAMYTPKTVNVRLWGQRVPAYAVRYGIVLAFDSVAGHFVPVEHLLTPRQISYVVSRTKVSRTKVSA